MSDEPETGAADCNEGLPARADNEIVRLLRHGEEEGLRELLRSHGAAVMHRLRRKFGWHRGPDIEDALSEATWKLWDKIDQYDPSRMSLRGWLYFLARNALVSALRMNALQKATMLWSPELLAKQPWKGPKEDPTKERNALLDALEKCIETLAPLQKDIVLSDLASGGAIGEEIAARWGTTVGSVYSSRHKAHQRLRTCLRKKGFDL